MNVLFVPTLGLDAPLLERLASSIDHPIRYKVAYNNGTTGALEGFRETHPDWIVKEPAIGNRGVAGSWNDCAKMFPQEQAWLLMNDDAYFLPGQLQQMINCYRAYSTSHLIFSNQTNWFHCYIWTAKAWQEIGTFDENLWPAYLEDRDYMIRVGLAKGEVANAEIDTVPHGKPKCGGIDYGAMIQGTGIINRQYYRRKWGNIHTDSPVPEYPTPYNDHRLTFKEWVWYPEHRAKLHPLWEAFMENPSIYD